MSKFQDWYKEHGFDCECAACIDGAAAAAWQEQQKEIDRLQEQLEAAEELLKDYARHDDGCSAAIHVSYRCRCRFDERKLAYDQLKSKS
jgi:hypothetical protein